MARRPTKPRRWTSQDDPRLHTPQWLAIRKEWGRRVAEANARGGGVYCEATPCLLPGVPIQIGGRRTPAHLDVGHLIAREHDPRPIWTMADTRPEHARCNRSAGRKISAAKARAAQANRPPDPMAINNDDW